MGTRGITAIVGLVTLFGSVACSGCGSSKSTAPTVPSENRSIHFHSVSIQNFSYGPAALTVAVGDTVLWTNNDSVTHTVTSDTGSELDGTLTPGQSYEHIFVDTGDYPYHCTIHPNMHGSVSVQ